MRNITPLLPLGYRPTRFPGEVVEINASIWYVDHDGYRVVGQGLETPLYRIGLSDEVELRFVAVSLRLSGLVRQREIAAAFGHSEETQRRWETRYQSEGLEGLRNGKATGRPPKLTTTQEKCVQKWLEEGVSNCQMASRLGVSEGTIRQTLKRLGLRPRRAAAPESVLFSDESGEVVVAASDVAAPVDESRQELAETDSEIAIPAATSSTVMGMGVTGPEPNLTPWVHDPMDRWMDRMFAAVGLLEDADPAFAEIDRLPRVGVLVAIPLLVRSGVLEVFQRIYGSIGPAFYGLRTTVVCLFFLALLRIKRPENLKEHNAQELGRLLGLDRAPEMKTLRRKLDRLARAEKGMDLMRALAELRAHQDPEALGALYLDGHVKEYHGKYATGKAFVSRRRLAAPGATDTWVNDLHGAPFFVVQSESNEGLTKTLEPILAEIQGQIGKHRPITVVFDRGGWSPKLFYRLIAAGYHLITYRKGHFPKCAKTSFERRTLEVGSEVLEYQVNDANRVRIGKSGNKKGEGPKYLWMRQVIRRREDGRQVAVITDRHDLPAEKVLYLMFNRWRQENFFKYMKQEFELDALLQYGSEPVSADLDRPNPEVRKLDRQIRAASAKLKVAQRELGERLRENQEAARPTVRGFKIANADAMRRVDDASREVDRLKETRAGLTKRVPAGDLVKLKRGRNLIADAVKMSAYQLENELCSLLEESYARCADEGRTLLHALFQSSGSIEVKPGELRITLAPQSSPHRTRAVTELCEKLTQMNTKFPGSNLTLSLAIQATNRSTSEMACQEV